MFEIKPCWRLVCEEAGIEGCRIRELRHTHASILASFELTVPIIGARPRLVVGAAGRQQAEPLPQRLDGNPHCADQSG